MSISVGGFSIDDSTTPVVNVNFEYYKSKGGEIIGGVQKYTISGVITKGGQGTTGAQVMSALSSIRQLGTSPKCIDVNLSGFYSGKAKVTGVNIEQGPDPAWINQGAFSIEITAPLTEIPPNSLGLTANDSVKDVSKSEKVELGEECHGYIYDSQAGRLSKTFAKFTNEVTLSWQPICSDTATPLMSVLAKLVTVGPTLTAFNKFGSWSQFSQSRSLDINTDGSITFKSEMVLVPPGGSASAFVDISFEHNQNYTDKSVSKKISGTVTGLSSPSWSGMIGLGDTCSASKLSNAEGAFSSIKGAFSNLSSWAGIELELIKLGNCPKHNNDTMACNDPANDQTDTCLVPMNSTISKNRTEGSITFDFEWANNTNGDCSTNGLTKEITIDITEPQVTFKEFVIPDVGTVLQNLNCRSAKTIQGICSVSTSNGCLEDLNCSCETALDAEINKYENVSNWLLITHSKQKTMNSFTLTKKYIRKCIQ